MCSVVPNARIASTFLHSNAQSHRNELYAWGDLVDNAEEAGATHLKISASDGGRLEVTDNGEGMSEQLMRDGVLAIGFTQKGAEATGQHYGMGSTTAAPRMARNVLFLSQRKGKPRTAGLLSSTLSEELGAPELKTPQCTWDANSKLLLTSSRDEPLTAAQRRASLDIILAHTPFTSEAELLQQFRALEENASGSGTRLIMWDLRGGTRVQGSDLVVAGAPKGSWSHDRSLRGFLEVRAMARRAAFVRGRDPSGGSWGRCAAHAR